VFAKNGENTAIDFPSVKKQIMSYDYTQNNKKDEIELHNKLIVTSFVESLVKVKNVHICYLPLILSFTDPGILSSNYILYNTMMDAIKVNEEPSKVVPLAHQFSMLTSLRISDLITDLIKLSS
jgi:hypothetical protein